MFNIAIPIILFLYYFYETIQSDRPFNMFVNKYELLLEKGKTVKTDVLLLVENDFVLNKQES